MNEKVPDKFLKPYDPVATEDRIYDLWEKSGYFNPDNLPIGGGANAEKNDATRFGFKDKNGKDNSFSIVLPPPNVTGILHMGSAFMLAIEDIMVRYARMNGKRALWIPGTDHAAIATQVVVEKEIQKKEGKSRHDLGREELLRRIDVFVTNSRAIITSQIRKMGSSIDWSREAFTLDEARNLAVCTAFKKMYDDGLIYRGYRVVNWDPKGQTTISDDEIEYETRKTKLYTFKYSKDIPISISTTRPETKLGDTAIAVNPNDKRYMKYIGQEFKANFAGESITLKVIADDSVDPEFGTGALGVTPAHSAIDWEMSQKHGLPLKPVINEYARMIVGIDSIKDKKVIEAREAVIVWLREQGLLEKEEEIEHNISIAQRTGGTIEPLPKLQWFVAVNKEFRRNGQMTSLKMLMKDAVSSTGIKIIPDRFEKVYFHWIENLRDWCISRQIWYGHRIPVWYKNKSSVATLVQEQSRNEADTFPRDLAARGDSSRGNVVGEVNETVPEEIYVGIEPPKGEGWIQDEDTLDTWFSAGLWTFSALGWPHFAPMSIGATRGKPNKDNDLVNYHPTTILETGSDILFFWVARMILMSTYLLNEVPFKTVYLHGLVRDTRGQKISKSLGNNIDPLDMIGKYGADAVRMSLIIGVGPGSDSKVDEQKIKAYKLFANKIWNITRFILTSTAPVADTFSMKTVSPTLPTTFPRGESPRAARPRGNVSASSRDYFQPRTAADEILYKELQTLLIDITADMENYRYYLAGEKLYHYVWHRFADIIIEESKKIFESGKPEEIMSRKQLLLHTLDKILRALHPFMPYVTEEIWQEMNDGESLLMIEKWPV